MLELNGYRYSKEMFEDYTHRAKFKLSVSEDWREDHYNDIYTDNPNKEEVLQVIKNRTKERVISCEMEHWTTKEQDDLAMEFLKDW